MSAWSDLSITASILSPPPSLFALHGCLKFARGVSLSGKAGFCSRNLGMNPSGSQQLGIREHALARCSLGIAGSYGSMGSLGIAGSHVSARPSGKLSRCQRYSNPLPLPSPSPLSFSLSLSFWKPASSNCPVGD